MHIENMTKNGEHILFICKHIKKINYKQLNTTQTNVIITLRIKLLIAYLAE